MDGAHSVTAVFSDGGATVLALSIEGQGLVTSTVPTGAQAPASSIVCQSGCTATYPALAQPSTLQLSEQPVEGWHFDHWQLGASTTGVGADGSTSCQASATQTCTVTIATTPLLALTAVFVSDSGPICPTSTVAPALTGQPFPGQVLSVSNGTWTGTSASYSYQWYKTTSPTLSNGTLIAGASGATFTLPSDTSFNGDYVYTVVTASNSCGQATATSTRVGAVEPPTYNNSKPYLNAAAPPLMSGQAFTLHTLSVSTGTWNSSTPVTLTYQWHYYNYNAVTSTTCQGVIPGATGTSYNVPANSAWTTAAGFQCSGGPASYYVWVTVTATNASGSVIGPLVNPKPANLTAPVLSDPAEAFTLHTSSTTTGSWKTTPAEYAPDSYTYQWHYYNYNAVTSATCQGIIPGATDATYVIPANSAWATAAGFQCSGGPASYYIWVTVTATNTYGSTAVNSGSVNQTTVTGSVIGKIVNPAPVNLIAPVTSGSAAAGAGLSSTTGTWQDWPTETVDDGAPVEYTPTSYAYNWVVLSCDFSGCSSHVLQSGAGGSYSITAQLSSLPGWSTTAYFYFYTQVTATNGYGSSTAPALTNTYNPQTMIGPVR